MTTAGDIIALALKDSGAFGVGQAALAEDTNDTFTRLNRMLAQWQRRRWLVFHLVDVSKVSTGAQSYTVYAGGSFNVARPDRLESAFVRQVSPSQANPPDWPLEIIESREEYSRIALKTLGSFPTHIFYDPTFPQGVVYPWPIPTAVLYEIHLVLKEQLSAFANLAATVNLPPEYEEAIHYNLCVRLRTAYQLPPDEVMIGLARSSLNTIRNANTAIGRLTMPPALRRGGGYNIYSDQGS